MIAVVVVLLLAAALAGVLAARRGRAGTQARATVTGVVVAALPAVLVAASAAVALAAPAAHGVGLAAVRVAAVLAAMAGGSALVTAAFALAGATGEDAPDEDPAPADAPGPEGAAGEDEPAPASPLRGGLAIGVLERAAIAVCVLANFGAGLAVIVAAKGLARYPELRHPGAAEQFIIGTFVSVLWAAACAGVAVALGR